VRRPLQFHSINRWFEYEVAEVAEFHRPEFNAVDAMYFIFNRRSLSQAGRRYGTCYDSLRNLRHYGSGRECMSKIFISFIHEEETVAKALQRFLQNYLGKEQEVFLSSDEWKVYAGEIWLQRIREELESASIVILLLSRTSVSRPWVNFEAGAAWLTNKIIIPVCFGDLSKGNMPIPYSGIQALNLDEHGAYYLIASLFHYLSKIHPTRPFLPPPPFARDDKSVRELMETVTAHVPKG